MQTRLIQFFSTFFALLIVFMSFYSTFEVRRTSGQVFTAQEPGAGTPLEPGTGNPHEPGAGNPQEPGAGNPQEPGIGETLPNPTSFDNICKLIYAFVNIVVEVGAIVAVLFIIWSGFLFITAQGKPEGLKKAKSTFYTTIIGTAILVGASVITKIIVNTVMGIVGGNVHGGICSP